jgi:hypothetical protein
MPKTRNQKKRTRRGGRSAIGRPQQLSVYSPPAQMGRPFTLVRRWLAGTISLNPGSDTFGTIGLGPTNWPSSLVTFITQSFTLFRVKRMRVTFVPKYSVNTGTSASPDSLGNLVLVPMYGAVNFAPATIDGVAGLAGAKNHRLTRPATIDLQPHILVPFATTTGSPVMSMPMPWMSTTNANNTFHLVGLLYGIYQEASYVDIDLDFFFEATIDFKQSDSGP